MSALTSLLVRDGVVPVRKIEEALSRQVISGGDVETVLLEMNAVPENVLAGYRAATFGLSAATREEVSAAPPQVIALVPREVAVEHRLVPLRVEGRALHVAAHEPLTREQEERVGFLLGFELVVHIVCEVRIAAALALHYGAELAPRMIRLVDRVRARDSGSLPAVGASIPPRGLEGHAAELPDKLAPPSTTPYAGTSRSGSFLLEPAEPEGGAAPSQPPPRQSAPPSALRRHRGPLTLAAAERYLKGASSRDEILEVLFAYAHQFFDYTALFVVHEDRLDGVEAAGVGAPPSEVRALSIPLDRPGAFAEVRRTRAPLVLRLDRTETDRDVAVGLRRPSTPHAFLMPIAIRTRVVVVLYGDRNGDEFDIGAVMELVKLGPRVVEAFEQLILRKKRAGYHDAPAAETASARADLKAAAKLAARASAEPRSTPKDSGPWWPARRSTPGFEVPDAAPGDDRWGGSDAVTPAAPFRAVTEAAPPAEAPGPVAEAPPLDERSSRAILGIPRSAPLPPRGGALDRALRRRVEEADDDAPELVLGQDEDDDELVITIGEDGEDEGGEGEGAEGAEGDDEEGDDADTQPRGTPARASDRPPRADGAYLVHEAPVDVVAAPPRRSERPRAKASEPPPRDPRREPDAPYPTPPPEVVRVPDRLASERPPRHTPGLDADTRSVIVDMGEQVHAQVDDLLAARDHDRQDELIRGIVTIGEAALPVLAQAFPGPLGWRREQGGRVPRAADLSPIARALVAFGPRAGPYVAGLLSSGHPDVRLYAAIVASEMVAPELLDAVAERVHDEDGGVRRLAVQLLPRFAGMRGFEEIRTVLRRTVRIRGRDLSRRWQAVDALASLRDVEMIPKLIELLREDDETLVKHAHEALVTLTGADFGSSHRKWAAWYERNRERHRVEWLIEALVVSDEAVRHAVGEELKRLTQQYYGYHAGSPRRDRERVAKKYRDWWEGEGRRRFA
ncbi:MAG: hypothetical protein KF729_34200 [Sandaracinaceae bacterium]|nr:hypothetical protein [Sandaracinaceae bacterium]